MNEMITQYFKSSLILTAFLAAFLAACQQAKTADSENPSAPRPSGVSAMENLSPLNWNEMLARYEAVDDYTTLYEKEEKAVSKGEKQVINLSFRKPFNIRMDWLDDKGKVDQTAIYQRGKNEDKVVAKRGGVLGSLVGAVKLAPTDPMALSDSKHPITEAGLGNLIEHFSRVIREPETNTNYLGEEKTLDGRPAYKFELSNPAGVDLTGVPGARKAVILIDREMLLPVLVEIYDTNGGLLERHGFKNLKLNQHLADKTFEL